MSHAPETSLTSRELVDQIYEALDAVREDIDARQAIVALIDAWVRVRETEARIEQHKLDHACEYINKGDWGYRYNCLILSNLVSALATARKQLEEKVK